MGYLDSPVGMNERKSMLWPWRLWKTTMILNGNWSANRGFSDLFMWISWGKCMKVRWYQVPTKMSIQWQTGNQTYWGTIMAPKAMGDNGKPHQLPEGIPKKKNRTPCRDLFLALRAPRRWLRRSSDTKRRGLKKLICLYHTYTYIYIYTCYIIYKYVYVYIYIYTHICYIIYKYMLYYIYVYYIIIL